MAAREIWQSAEGIIDAKRALPDPILSYTYFVENVETRVGPQEQIFGIKQMFPFYGKRGLRGDIAGKESEAYQGKYQTVQQEVVRQVKNTFYDLFYVVQIIEVTGREQDLLRQMERSALTKYETGSGNQQNVLKLQVEISKLEERLLALATQKNTSEKRLNKLLDRPAEGSLARPVQPEFKRYALDKAMLLEMAQNQRPELKAQHALIGRSEKALGLARKDYFPDVTIGANYVQVDDGPLLVSDNGQDAFNVMVSLNLPIWQGKLSSQVDSAAQTVSAQKNRYRNQLNQTMFEVEDLFFKIQRTEETYDLYKDVLLVQGEQSLRSAEAGYQTGTVNFLDLLDAERTLLKIQYGYWKAYADYLKHVANLERALGVELPGDHSKTVSSVTQEGTHEQK